MNRFAFCFLAVLALFCSSVSSFAEEAPPIPDYLARLTPSHPRILVSQQRQAQIEDLLKTDSFLQNLLADQLLEADALLADKSTVIYKIVGPRLLSQSRECLKRVLTLAGAYRLTPSAEKRKAYRDRALKELSAAAAFPDWNPSHFLDTAEMTAGFAIGYDWLFDSLSEEEKKMIETAIYEKGIIPGLENKWFWNSPYNWNQVCNGGIVMGALAIADRMEEQKRNACNQVIHRAIKGVPKAMATFAPDGSWGEGPAYWQYTVLYTTFLINTLEASLGSDFGISNSEGFDKCGDDQMALASATGWSYNFADSGSVFISQSMDFWLADRFDKPIYAEFERRAILQKTNDFQSLKQKNPSSCKNLYPLNVWYYSPKRADLNNAPLDFYFRKVELVSMRSSWNGRNGWYIGFKAGGNAVNHSHLELGSFILEHDAIRWAVDLGSDDYNLPDYFGRRRWTYYRLSTLGQNTLLFDGQNQSPQAFAPITKFVSQPELASATADLSDAYKKQVKSVFRTITLDRKNDSVLIEDQIGPVAEKQSQDKVKSAESVAWQIHTPAEIEMESSGKTAILKKEGKAVCFRILNPTPESARFSVHKTTQSEVENPNIGISVLAIELPLTENVQTIKVEIVGSTPAADK